MRSAMNSVKINHIRAVHHPLKWASSPFSQLNPLYHQILLGVRGGS